MKNTIILIFTKKSYYTHSDADFPPALDENFFTHPYHFCWLDKKNNYLHFFDKNIPQINSNGLLLVNDGSEDKDVKTDDILKCLKRTIGNSNANIYTYYHKTSYSKWKLNISKSLSIKRDERQSNHIPNRNGIIYNRLTDFYQGTVEFQDLFIQVFGDVIQANREQDCSNLNLWLITQLDNRNRGNDILDFEFGNETFSNEVKNEIKEITKMLQEGKAKDELIRIFQNINQAHINQPY